MWMNIGVGHRRGVQGRLGCFYLKGYSSSPHSKSTFLTENLWSEKNSN